MIQNDIILSNSCIVFLHAIFVVFLQQLPPSDLPTMNNGIRPRDTSMSNYLLLSQEKKRFKEKEDFSLYNIENISFQRNTIPC